MLFVSIIQFIAVSLTLTALFKDELMISPEENGVTCNITSPLIPKQNISAEHLIVYWRWQTLEVRWDFLGQQNTQIWLAETYKRTYDCRCKGRHCGSRQPHNTTHAPTKQPILHPPKPTTHKPTHTTLSPSKSPTRSPTIVTPSPSKSPTNSPTEPSPAPSTAINKRKLLRYEDYDDNG